MSFQRYLYGLAAVLLLVTIANWHTSSGQGRLPKGADVTKEERWRYARRALPFTPVRDASASFTAMSPHALQIEIETADAQRTALSFDRENGEILRASFPEPKGTRGDTCDDAKFDHRCREILELLTDAEDGAEWHCVEARPANTGNTCRVWENGTRRAIVLFYGSHHTNSPESWRISFTRRRLYPLEWLSRTRLAWREK